MVWVGNPPVTFKLVRKLHSLQRKKRMTEKISIKGSDVWIKVESHVVNENEYFTATYYSINPESSQSGILLTEKSGEPLTFKSPVEALEYCTEKLMELNGLRDRV
jgi:hypothetical protein